MPYQPKRPSLDPCPVEAAVALFSAKWKARILLELHGQAQSFGQLRRRLAGISQQVLSTQLQDLETDGILSRAPLGPDPMKGSLYALTPEGRSLLPVLDGLADWGLGRLEREGLTWQRPPSSALGRGSPTAEPRADS